MENVIDFFLCVLGLVFIIEGIPYFAFPDKLKQYLGKIQEIQDSRLRIMGLAAMIFGLVLLYFGRK
jgi:uncharacterized protein YjeT (DUF2065 family)